VWIRSTLGPEILFSKLGLPDGVLYRSTQVGDIRFSSITCCTIENVGWLGGQGYSCMLYMT
jgi:hypothetical protein